jgi:hypothetical protein
MKTRKFLVILPLIISLLIFLLTVFSISVMANGEKNGVSIQYTEDFFNQFEFNNGNFYTETFQRYHWLRTDLAYNNINFTIIYNWVDNVNGAVSTHKITPWAGILNYNPNENSCISLEGWWFFDTFIRQNTHEASIVYTLQHNFLNELDIQYKLGLRRFIESSETTWRYSILLNYKDRYHFSINDLDSMDDRLLDAQDKIANIPLNAGTFFCINERTKVCVDLYYYLKHQEVDPNLWIKTKIQFQLWE